MANDNLSGLSADAIARGNPQLRKFADAVLRELASINDTLGRRGGVSADTGKPEAGKSPTACAFKVTGGDGRFRVQITNPQYILPPAPSLRGQFQQRDRNQLGRTILHQVQSAKDSKFASGSDVADYGISERTDFEIFAGNQLRYFRLRSSYDGYTWNAWQLQDAVDSGLVGDSAKTVLLETDGEANTDQSKLNLISGDGVTLTSDDDGGVTIAASVAARGVNVQTVAAYTIAAEDNGKLIVFDSPIPVAVSLPPATSFSGALSVELENINTGLVTVTAVIDGADPASLIDGGSVLFLQYGQGVQIISDSVNYYTQRGGVQEPRAANVVLAGPTAGVDALPTFRTLDPLDIPAFLFDQAVASAIWTIAHNLNRYPQVTVIDSTGREVKGQIQYDSVNQVTVTFTAPFAGQASLI
jgi:hypothetical protein